MELAEGQPPYIEYESMRVNSFFKYFVVAVLIALWYRPCTLLVREVHLH